MGQQLRIRLAAVQLAVVTILFLSPLVMLLVLRILLPLEAEVVDIGYLYRLFWLISIIVVAAMGIVVTLIIVLSKRHFIDPLMTLSDRAQGYSRGIPTLVRECYTVSEIDDLARSVNDLMDTVMMREESLHTLNESLEETVRLRTQAHEETIETLQSARDRLMLSEKMAALGSLVSGVAHEINTPLSIGVTAASFLNERTRALYRDWDVQALTQENLERFLKDSEESSRIVQLNLDNAAKIINSLKQVAVDQQTEECREFELGTYLDDILLSLKHQLRQGKHLITARSDGLIMVDTFPGAITQILNNLVFNSVAHGFEKQEGGKIRIETFLDGNEVVLVYRDDGRGLSPEEFAHLFDQFYTTRRGRGGTGLGMNIVRDLVTDKLGGQIDVAPPSEEGAGFTIRFPANGSAEVNNEVNEEETEATGGTA